MKDIKPIDDDQPNASQHLTFRAGEKGRGAMQGWTALDGTNLHMLYEGVVEGALDQTALHEGICREVSSEMGTSAGELDTYIKKGNQGLVIDYKTHNMSGWSLGDAEKYATEHGSQVQKYMHTISQDGVGYSIPAANLAGCILAVGKLPEKPQVLSTYQTVLGSFGVNFMASPGDAESVKKAVIRLAEMYEVF